jgi:hypothetical protein
MSNPSRPTVILPDFHARPELPQAVEQHFGPYDVNFVVAGDTILGNGPDDAGTLAQLRKMNAELVLGGAEWGLLAQMDDENPANRQAWATARARHDDTLLFKSYDVPLDLSEEEAMAMLKEHMQDTGDYQYLVNGALFFEKKKSKAFQNGYAVTHAGLTQTIWPLQATQLAVRNHNRIHHNEYGSPRQVPPQLFGGRVMEAEAIKRQAEKGIKYPTSIRGHYHHTPDDRVVEAGGRLITLATEIKTDEAAPIRVIDDWRGEVIEIHAS